MRVSGGTGAVLARIECSPEIFDFRANGILDQESVDFFDTLKRVSFKTDTRFVLRKITAETGLRKEKICLKKWMSFLITEWIYMRNTS